MNLHLTLLPATLAVCRLPAGDPLPDWIRGSFTSMTRTPDELSIVCDEDSVPPAVQAERNWKALMLRGPIPFELTGVAAALLEPLAAARISVFVLSTFDTDYVLVRSGTVDHAIRVLREAGHEVA